MHDSTGVEENFVPVDLLATPNYLSSKKHSININQNRILVILILTFLIVTVLGLITGLLVPRRKLHKISSSECFEAACPESWIGFQRKCFYFSDDVKNWTFSQRFCDSYGADLVQIETLLELNFLLRYKGPYDHWIGLSRDLGQPWKWVNGTEWTNCFPIRGGGECAYLNDKGASSARRYTERKWICSKPDIYAQMKRQNSI